MIEAVTPMIQTRSLERDFAPRRRLFRRNSGTPQRALVDVTIEVQLGECVALIGPNGAGKSTLIRVLATILTPTRGEASVGGADVARRPDLVRGQVGFSTGDHRSFFWPLSAMENLAFFGELQGLRREDALSNAGLLLSKLDLDPNDRRPISDYSSGMRQRAALARSLLHDPRVLLLDEPTANLDRESRERVIELLTDFRTDGEKAILLATHDADLVARVADRTLRMEGGSVSEVSHERVITYRIHMRSGDSTLQGPSTGSRFTEDRTETMEVIDAGDGHQISAAISRIIAEGGEVISIETRES